MSAAGEAQVRRALPALVDVSSPCIAVCEMLPEAGVCGGCFRTLDEIAAWGALDAGEKRAVVAALPQRRARWTPRT